MLWPNPRSEEADEGKTASFRLCHTQVVACLLSTTVTVPYIVFKHLCEESLAPGTLCRTFVLSYECSNSRFLTFEF